MAVVISEVQKRSLAFKAKIPEKATLLTINGNEINDVLDYQFYITERQIELVCLVDGKEKSFKIVKDEYEDIGLIFDSYLMDKQHHCKNKCIFCFIDQMPKGMRESLYFKDDDDRMSFLFGNYITLTNLTQRDIDRIIKMHISPVNISVHTTDPELRVKMMKNKNAGECLKWLEELAAHGIKLNTQLVLCPEINDGEQLVRSLNDLAKLAPNIESIAAVPVGLTDHREGLEKLRPYTEEESCRVIDIIESFCDKFFKEHGVRIAFASDEFYLKANRPLPDYDYYGDFSQLENGVGLITLLRHDFYDSLENDEFESKPFHSAIATGKLAYPLMCELAESAMKKYPNARIDVHMIENEFFGENITVAGLITGRDLINQLKGKLTARTLLIPTVMLRHERDRFLDDVLIEDVERELQVELVCVENDGYDLLNSMLGCEA